MLKSFAACTVGAFAALILSSTLSHAQTAPAKAAKTAPAPRHDISGTWTPVREGSGIGGQGAADFPEDGKPEHKLPYTPAALEKMKSYRPGNGSRQNVPSMINDPAVIYCDPMGMPRQDLYELRDTQIIQTPLKVVVLYEFSRIWRVIWTDGRELPKDPPEQRWYGYSVGKWADDYTFVAQTSGTDARTWLDKGGRPHSEDLVVEERFHRANKDLLELTVTIHDPAMYTKDWTALNKFPMKALPAEHDVREMMCSVTEYMQYNKQMGFGNPSANFPDTK